MGVPKLLRVSTDMLMAGNAVCGRRPLKELGIREWDHRSAFGKGINVIGRFRLHVVNAVSDMRLKCDMRNQERWGNCGTERAFHGRITVKINSTKAKFNRRYHVTNMSLSSSIMLPAIFHSICARDAWPPYFEGSVDDLVAV
jgi:hypothetical protein